MSQKTKQKLWVVSCVWRGFPAYVKVYKQKRSAKKHIARAEKNFNPDYDSIEMFEVHKSV